MYLRLLKLMLADVTDLLKLTCLLMYLMLIQKPMYLLIDLRLLKLKLLAEVLALVEADCLLK